jgi:hypothetical protein
VKFIYAIFLTLLSLSSPLCAEEARLYLEPLNKPEVLALGDTLEVGVYIDAGALALTSASIYFSYDTSAYALVPVEVLADGQRLPFASGPFLSATVYENAVSKTDAAQLSYISVSGVGFDGGRAVGSGSGLLASVRLRVVDYPAQGRAAVWLEAAGQHQPSYTLLDEPGVEQRFYVEAEPLYQTVEPEGLIALTDHELQMGETVEIDLTAHFLSSVWGDRDLHWQATVREGRGAVVALEGTKLRVIATESVFIDYWVETPGGVRRSGEFAVRIAARERYLQGLAIDMLEDGGVFRRVLGEYLIKKDRAGTWSVRTGVHVTAAIEDGELVVGAPADWAGEDGVELSFCSDAENCDSIRLAVSVAAQNDGPTIELPSVFDLAVGQRLSWPLQSIFGDVDHEMEELLLSLEGGDVAAVYREGDVLVVEAFAVGVEQVGLRVEDPRGLSAETTWELRVSAPSAGPQFLPLPHLQLALGEPLQIDLKSYVKDGDTSAEKLAWSLRAEGMAASWVDDEPSILLLRGTEVGMATLYLTVRDPEGSEAVTAWSVQVVGESTGQIDKDGQESIGDILGAVVDTVVVVEPAEESRETASGATEPIDEMNWSIAPLGRIIIQAGQTVSIPLQPYVVGQSEGQIRWSVEAVQGVAVEVENDTAILHAEDTYAGRLVLLFSAVDAAGQRHSEVLEVEVAGGQQAMVLGDIPDLELRAGTAQRIDLINYVDRAVVWSVSGGGGLDISIVEDVAIVRAPTDFAGRSVLLFSAVDADGNAAVDIVRVEILVDDIDVEEPNDGGETPSTDVDIKPGPPKDVADAVAVLELGVWPDYVLEIGAVDSTQILDELVLVGDAAAVQWSLRGGAFVGGVIDASRRIVFDGRAARSGREVFFLKAVLGAQEREVTLGVQVRESFFELVEPAAIALVDSNGYELGKLVRGAVEAIEWQVFFDEGSARIEAGRLYVEAAPGSYVVLVSGRTVSGRQEQVALHIDIAVDRPAIEDLPTAVPSGPGFAPLFDMPEQIELEEGGSTRWPLRVVDEDSAWEDLVFSLVAEGDQARIEGAELLIVAGAESFGVELRVRDEWGNEANVFIDVLVAAKDRTPPQIELVGSLAGAGQMLWTLRADEEVHEALLLVDGQPLPVQEQVGAYVSWLHAPLAGVLAVRVVVSDRAGNTVQKKYDAVWGPVGGGFVLQSFDEQLRVLGGSVSTPALLYAEREGYRLDFDPGQRVEIALVSAIVDPGLYYGDGSSWREIGATLKADSNLLRAVLSAPGWLRADTGQHLVIATEAALVYPNPFNATAAIRLYMPTAGLLHAVVYDVLGRRVQVLVEESREAGAWTLLWHGRDERGNEVASGVYFVDIGGPGWNERARMLLLR